MWVNNLPLAFQGGLASSDGGDAPRGGAALPPDAVACFDRDGFLVVPALCDAAEQGEIRLILEDLFLREVGRREGSQFDMLGLDRGARDALQPQIINPSIYAPLLRQTRYFQTIKAIASQILGAGAAFSFDHSILKPAGRVAATPWHQDEAHRQDVHFHCDQVSFWMPLQDVSELNGCMRYVPGSNRGALLPHRSLGNDPRIHALECLPEHFDEAAASVQPVPAGWCILHAGRTLHSALPNRSGVDRLVYIISFRGLPRARSAPQHLPWLMEKNTSASKRHQRWRMQGGFMVLALRRLHRALRSDIRTLPLRLWRALRRFLSSLPGARP